MQTSETKIVNTKIDYTDWGLTEYNEAWKKQEEIFQATILDKKEGRRTKNTLIFCEHPHVYTLGRSGDNQNLLLNFIQLQAKNATFVQTDRGGDITYHGPGQIVGYPIFDLENFQIGLKQYIHLIEEAIIRLLADFGVESTRLEGATGVWLDLGKPTCRKICAIGVRSSKFVTMHGFALNIQTNLDYFSYINPCGFVDKGVTSLEKELAYQPDMELVKEKLVDYIRKVFAE